MGAYHKLHSVALRCNTPTLLYVVMYAGAMTPASRSFAPASYQQRRLSDIVRVAAAQPEPEPKPNGKPSKKPDKLSSEELFERCERLEATGLSREAAKTIVTTTWCTTQFMAERTWRDLRASWAVWAQKSRPWTRKSIPWTRKSSRLAFG